jgi:hypothetical protein
MIGQREPVIQLDRVHFIPRDSLIVVANAVTMLWVKHRFQRMREPFSVSQAACQWVTELDDPVPETIGIRVPETLSDYNREIVLWEGDRKRPEVQSQVPYPNFRAPLAQRADQKRADFEPSHYARLYGAMALIAGQRDLPVHVIRRGSAVAFVVCRVSTLLGFIAPWSEARQAEAGAVNTLKEFGLYRPQTVPAALQSEDKPG